MTNMAQNLFEKYGIKEVADVTLYRIERKDETFESQREISISSILKGALTKQVVYPLDEDGKGEVDGYEAYVFKDADILKHYNYDCDDAIEAKGTALWYDTDRVTAEIYKTGEEDPIELDENTKISKGDYEIVDPDSKDRVDLVTYIENYLKEDLDEDNIPNLFDATDVNIKSLLEIASNRDIRSKVATLVARGYKINNIAVGIDNKELTYKGNSKSNLAFDDSDLYEWVAKLISPMTFKGDQLTNVLTLKGIIEAGGGTLTVVDEKGKEVDAEGKVDGEAAADGDLTITGGELVIGAPYNATGDEIRARYNIIYTDLLASTGILCRFTQPVRTLKPYLGDSFTGEVEATIAVPTTTEGGDEGEVIYNITASYRNVTLTKDEYDLLSQETYTKPEIEKLVAIFGKATTIVVSNGTESSSLNALSEALTKATEAEAEVEITDEVVYNKFLIYFTLTLDGQGDILNGIYDLAVGTVEGHYVMDTDYTYAGTHEYTYAEQVCMLFAKNQNLITRTGNRYKFADPDGMFGAFEFDDNFAAAPNSTEQVVVVGLVGRTSENLYDFDEINDAIKDLTDKVSAKAYDITYTDYAELVVEDEMGYYLPQQLGYSLDKKTATVAFFNNYSTDPSYEEWAKTQKGVDLGIRGAIHTWGNDTHYSINDAIDALKQESKVIDGEGDVYSTGFTRIYGGYKVRGEGAESILPLDDVGRGGEYEDYLINGNHVYDATIVSDIDTTRQLKSSYALEDVLEKLAVADFGDELGQLRVSTTSEIESNRAIYVDADNGVLSNRAFIYLLKNVNSKVIANDKNGIFEFRDKKGNRLYYQDKVFAGTAYLALVVIGTMGLIFVVDRHCTKNFSQVAWMINDNGYITDKQAKRIVKNGLIHTVTVTACDESFDATCTVGSIKVRKTKKNVLRYVPVLFLDTLKVSTIEQASETTDATGGRGNAKLITWDYGKEITLSLEDALFTPASMAAIWAGEHGDLKNGVKDTTMIDRMEKITAKRSFIVPAGNQEGTPTEGDITAQAVYYDPKTMEPFQDGTPIAEGEVIYKFTRSVAYEGNSIGNTIEISADKFPGTYRVVGETFVRDKTTGEDQRFQFIIPEAKMSAEDSSITLEADGDPVVFDFTMTVLRPDNGVMMKFVQFDVEENTEENDGSTMVKDTENLNLLDDAEMYKVSGSEDEELVIGATEY